MKIVSIRKHRSRQSVRRIAPFVVAVLVGSAAGLGYVALDEARPTEVAAGDNVVAIHYSLCGRPPHRDCIIDGDTFYFGSQSVRIADIDTPETHPPRCAYEAELGQRATRRLRELLNAGPFELRHIDRDVDKYGRKLRIVMRDGRSIGGALVSEGLPGKWTGRRRPWCS